MTTDQLRAEAKAVEDETGSDCNTRAALLVGAADRIDRLEQRLKNMLDLHRDTQNQAVALASEVELLNLDATRWRWLVSQMYPYDNLTDFVDEKMALYAAKRVDGE